jgi:hypothetical protein
MVCVAGVLSRDSFGSTRIYQLELELALVISELVVQQVQYAEPRCFAVSDVPRAPLVLCRIRTVGICLVFN